VGDGDYVGSVAARVCRVAVDFQRSLACRNGDLFLVGASQDEDALSGGGGSTQRVDSGLNLEQSAQSSCLFDT